MLFKFQSCQPVKLPLCYQRNLEKAEENRVAWERIQQCKIDKKLQEQEVMHSKMDMLYVFQKATRRRELEKKKERKEKLKNLLEQIQLEEQERINAAQLQQQEKEQTVYEKKYGKVN